ncbi:hypothetical protein ABMA28_000462 [Loxostege sticticalis]|uniref:Period circadian protein n=1 Tax=Loxostege sticticalis TaxID=481309 RepID=A0ABD0TSM0_LOXSC
MDIASPDTSEGKEEVASCNLPIGNTNASVNLVASRPPKLYCSEGFSCVISMHDGVVMYTTASLTTILGFPKDMWIGRSFIDFIHPRDRNTFASQITSGLAIPKIVNGTEEKVQTPGNPVSTMVCRIRRYRGLSAGFGVKERTVTFMPFLLKLAFKNVSDEEGELTYLVIQATPFFSAFKVPNEIAVKPIPFVMRHAANGNLEYIDPESVPYLGYLPQDVVGEDAIKLYHHDDLCYLRQVYETIVKEGGVPRCKPYRMMTQNGDYVKLETEWSSFINPWSRKLEFVIGKHHLIEGPTNPDVFQAPDTEKAPKIPEEEKNKHQSLRDSIVKIMNEVLTKPAEVAKQQMSKRCQDLASFMESLMEEPLKPSPNDQLQLEIQDTDHSYYERDSMLGGISPHHDYNDCKSSTETPLSYNQLNYNENMQRYFESHQPFSCEDYNTVTGENILGLKDTKQLSAKCLSPMAQHSGDSGEMTSSCESGLVVRPNSPVAFLGDYQRVRLTETVLNKHNSEMEKKLLRVHRETRSSSKGEREKTSNEKRQKKKEHLARCNASFQPAAVGTASTPGPVVERKSHGVKRSSKQVDSETVAHKHHCSSLRQSRRRHVTSAAPAQPSATITTTVGMFPMYYAPAQPTPIPSGSEMTNPDPTKNANANAQFPAPAMQCMMYGQAMYGSPFMYSPIAPQMSQMTYPAMQQSMMHQTTQFNNSLNPLGLTSSNYEESTEAVPDTAACRNLTAKSARMRNSDGTVDRTDGDSSSSSFYSSFFKTESGSAEDSGDKLGAKLRTTTANFWTKSTPDDQSSLGATKAYRESKHKKITRRKMEPPWMEQVCVSSELIYKYQVLTKTLEEVLTSDKQKMINLAQPSLVNEQLGQLYLDLQLEGVAARLTLEEGITSSSSSGEETTTNSKKTTKRKREYSKLVMIYEEDAPLPPPADDDMTPSTTT